MRKTANLLPCILLFLGLSIIVFITLKGIVIFDIDIARDFLLINDIILKKNLTLIGARTAINGVFHGPAWLYLNLPVFLLSHGNPLIVAWFWVILFLGMLCMLYSIARNLFDRHVAVLSLALITSEMIFFIKAPTNPYLAVLFFPVFFYFLQAYLRQQKAYLLMLVLMSTGLMIHGEMVFGIPIMVCSLPLILYKIVKQKLFSHFLIFFLLMVTLSNFIFFEITHQFIQINSLARYLMSAKSAFNFSKFMIIFFEFSQGMRLFLSSPHAFSSAEFILNLIPFSAMIFLILNINKYKQYKLSLLLFCYFYLGFWFVMLLTRSNVYWYYYWPFIGIATILVSLAGTKNRIFYLLIVVGIVYNLIKGVVFYENPDVKKSFWLAQLEYSSSLFKTAPSTFGYFVNTFDQVGNYIPMYAMAFISRSFPEKKANPFTKQKNTFVIAGAYPDGKPLDNKWWILNKLHIKSAPSSRKVFSNGYSVERYILSGEEINSPTEPIFDSIQYR